MGVHARWLVAGVLAITCLLVLMPASAAAHAELLGTVPENDQLVQAAPDHIELKFSEDITVSFGGIKVFGPDGSRLQTGSAKVDGHDVHMDLDASKHGTYAVSWRAISADGHPVRGAFTFSVGERGSDAAKGKALAESKTSRGQSIAYGIARGVTLLGLLGAVGAAWFSALVVPGYRPRWIVPLLVTLLVGSVASYVLDAAIAGGFSISDTLHWSVLREQAGTVYGRAGLIRTALAVAALASVRWLTGNPRYLVLVVFVLLAESQSLAGHAVATEPVWLRLPADMLHTLAACVWLGGLVQLRASVRTGAATARQVVRFSNMALASVLVLVVTGTYAAYTEIGLSMEGLTSTTYGRLVLGKVALYVVLLGFGAINRQRLVPALEADWANASRRLARFVAAEVGLLVLVISLTAWLIAAVPARNEIRPGLVDVTKRGDRGSMQLIVDPARAGSNQVHVYVFNQDEQPDATVKDLKVEVENHALGIQHLAVRMSSAGPGHYTTSAASIPYPGTWTFHVFVKRSAFDEQIVDAKVRIARQ
jgi:copper transport protein